MLAELSTDELRAPLRDSIRGVLKKNWSVERGRHAQPAEVKIIWGKLVEQGVAALGRDPSEAGLREISVVMEELGRAACLSPMLATALTNLALRQTPAASQLLNDIEAGTSVAAWAFAGRGRDSGGNCFRLDGEMASGCLRFVEVAENCTHLIVSLGDTLAIIDLADAGVTLRATRAMGAWGLYEVSIEEARATLLEIDSASLRDLARHAKLLMMARAYGAATRAFELAVAYATQREQFGQPIGRFQAIQHKLANSLIDLEGVQQTLDHAAELCDRGDRYWRHFADCANAFASDALRRVALETQHAFGAIGYADEHEAPIHFKRVHLDSLALGGSAKARRDIASSLLDDGGHALPQYYLGPAGNAFREQVEKWLGLNWTGTRKAAFDAQSFSNREFDARFAKEIGETGWIGLAWPLRHGGQGRSPLEQLAFMEVMERYEAPRIGAAIQANAIMMFGTREQQQRYLPEILRGEAIHGMGYSEPQAGSDLAALRTSATLEGDHWVINGQKIWTTTWWGKYMFLAARTDKSAQPPHAGISMFIVPMNAEGISIRPATTMYDGTFANIFYDNVRIPQDNLLGDVNGGWKVLTGALAQERGLVGGGIVLKVVHAFERLRQHVMLRDDHGQSLADDSIVRDKMAVLASEIEVGRRLMMRCAELGSSGSTPPEYGAMSKVFSSELMERFCEAALEILGMPATLSEQMPGAIDNGRFEQNMRHSLMWVISIGTNEIQRSLIAQRALGLPR